MHTAVNHFATPEFWYHYRRLPPEVRELADKNFALLRQDPHHPSLRLKKVGSFRSARVGLRYRAAEPLLVVGRERFAGWTRRRLDSRRQPSHGPPRRARGRSRLPLPPGALLCGN